MKLNHRTFKTPTNRTLEITTVSSNYHVEINPSDVGSGDRFVVQEVIKEMAQSGSLTARASMAASEASSSSLSASASSLGAAAGSASASAPASSSGSARAVKAPFKVVVLTDVDRLSRDAQAALRRTMELYTSSCRLILICESASRVIEPVRSRCLALRIAAPTAPEIMKILDQVSRKEGIDLPKPFAAKIARASDRNLRRAILMLEASKVQQYPFTATQMPQTMDWQRYIEAMAGEIASAPSPGSLLSARKKMYELLINCIPSDVILRTLCHYLCLRAPNDFARHQIVSWATAMEVRLRAGSKEIFHLEAFVARSMQVLKTVQIEMSAHAAAAAPAAASSSSSAGAGAGAVTATATASV